MFETYLVDDKYSEQQSVLYLMFINKLF